MPRLSPIDRDKMNDEQNRIYDNIAGGPRGGVRGPFNVLLHSPELADRAQALGAYVRYNCAVPWKLREFAILICAHHWEAEYERYAHESHARKAGLDEAIITAVREGTKPPVNNEPEKLIYDFCTQLLDKHRVDDDTYARAVRELGENGTVDLVGLLGHYSLIAMTLNAFEVPIPDGG